MNDTEIDPLNPMGGLQGRGWEGAREGIRTNLLDQMGKDMTFNNSLYHSKDRALRHWLQGTNMENQDYSGKGWGRKERSRRPDYGYYPDDVYRRDGGMIQYKPGGMFSDMWDNDADWKFTYRTQVDPYRTFAVQSGLNSSIDQLNADKNRNKMLMSKSTVNASPYAQTAGKSVNYFGTTNAKGYNPDRTAQPGNFSIDAYQPRYLNNVSAKSGGSILDYYEDGAEVDRLLRIISSDLSENELFGLTDEHLAIVNQRREMHLAGESNSFSLEEVIISARNSILK
jgi:hypothetical protein